jgi:AcrR family transcriptional regulator
MSTQRADQRTRILRAIVEVVAEDGYLGAKIGEISSRAGVSRATFYEMFPSKQDCFLQAQREHASELLARLRRGISAAAPEQPVQAALAVLAGVAQEEPERFVFLTHEAMLAGAQALGARERLLGEIAALIDDATIQAGRVRGGAPDMPASTLVGAAVRTLGTSIRRGERELNPLLGELRAWSVLYDAPEEQRRWRELKVEPTLIRAAGEAGYPAFAPRGSPRGRHGQSAALVRRTQRERILHATAAAISQKGYEHTSVTDIVTAAGLSRDVFYKHLSSRRDALEQASGLFFEQAIATMAGAFFTAPDSWAQRLWSAGVALSEFMLAAPAFARVACIDAYAPGRVAARRTDELLLRFTVFIEQGAGESEPGRAVPALAPAAVVAALAETVVGLLAGERMAELPGFVALGVYLALAPYTGVRCANEFVERKLGELAHSG